MSDSDEKVTWYKITESNEWEGETWYYYFESDSQGKVLAVLQSAVERSDGELEGPETVELTWDQAETLTNLDDGGYMQTHWFGELIDFEGLAKADHQKLYKGGIRDFSEEAFGYSDEPCTERDNAT